MVNYLTFQIQQKQKTIEINDSKDINLWNKNSNIKKFQSERKEDLMWYNLIYIELNFKINSIIILKKQFFLQIFIFMINSFGIEDNMIQISLNNLQLN